MHCEETADVKRVILRRWPVAANGIPPVANQGPCF